jgi:hypothetical protein
LLKERKFKWKRKTSEEEKDERERVNGLMEKVYDSILKTILVLAGMLCRAMTESRPVT